ncbi:40S ribosomal protein S13 [Bienertia sinuspersici]
MRYGWASGLGFGLGVGDGLEVGVGVGVRLGVGVGLGLRGWGWGWGWPRGVGVQGMAVLGRGLGVQVEENICKFAKKGLTPSQIGVILRDSHAIAQVESVTGSKILRVLKATAELFYEDEKLGSSDLLADEDQMEEKVLQVNFAGRFVYKDTLLARLPVTILRFSVQCIVTWITTIITTTKLA